MVVAERDRLSGDLACCHESWSVVAQRLAADVERLEATVRASERFRAEDIARLLDAHAVTRREDRETLRRQVKQLPRKAIESADGKEWEAWVREADVLTLLSEAQP
jgi:hypothetical protein